MCVHAQSCLTLRDPMDSRPSSSSAHGILQARILEWVVVSYSRESSQPRNWTHVSWVSSMAGRFFTTEPAGRPNRVISKNKISWHPNFCCRGKLLWRLALKASNISAGLPLPHTSSLPAANSNRNLHIITKLNTNTHQTLFPSFPITL